MYRAYFAHLFPTGSVFFVVVPDYVAPTWCDEHMAIVRTQNIQYLRCPTLNKRWKGKKINQTGYLRVFYELRKCGRVLNARNKLSSADRTTSQPTTTQTHPYSVLCCGATTQRVLAFIHPSIHEYWEYNHPLFCLLLCIHFGKQVSTKHADCVLRMHEPVNPIKLDCVLYLIACICLESFQFGESFAGVNSQTHFPLFQRYFAFEIVPNRIF